MQSLTSEQNKIHLRAIYLAKRHRALESQLVEILQAVDRLKIYNRLGKNSLFVYATEILGLDKSVAYALITVARKSTTIPQLKTALDERAITLSKASRIVSSLNPENAMELIEFASTHTREELDFELARRNPKSAARDKMKPISEDLVELKVTISKATFAKLQRAESLSAQKGESTEWGEVLDVSLETFLDKNDPVRKAERAKREKGELLPARVGKGAKSARRVPPTAAQKHAVFYRDQGKCTHVGLNGQRCNQDRWVEIHHIIPVSRGGSNDPENLTTLCSHHHDLVHQLSLPIEGQVTWLRSPVAEYGFVSRAPRSRHSRLQ